jgi:hypothetical protein
MLALYLAGFAWWRLAYNGKGMMSIYPFWDGYIFWNKIIKLWIHLIDHQK